MAAPDQRPRVLLRPKAWLLATGLICLCAVAVYKFRPLQPLPKPGGRIEQASSQDWGRIAINESHCVLVNNVWNKAAAGDAFRQEVFLEDTNGKRAAGWRWRSPWHLLPRVVSQPQLVCGDKPWDHPLRWMPEFPFQAGSKRLTAAFDIKLRASGTYNMAFTMWAVRALPASKDGISHEIMIWNANGGQSPAGMRRGTLDAQGNSYDVYVEENHGDASGHNPNVWTYVAFVARKPVWRGPLDLSVFLDYLLQQKILSPDHYLTSLELGNEVSQGEGIVEIQDFSIRLQ
jgi:hypothetical protein